MKTNLTSLLPLLPSVQDARALRRKRHCRLFVERLEERTVLSSFAVSFGGADSESPNGARATDPDGSSYLSGSLYSQVADFDPGPGIHNLTSAGASDAFIAKYDAQGGFLWARNFGGTGSDYASRAAFAAETAGDFVYLSGSFTGTADFGPGLGAWTSAGSGDLFLIKLRADTGETVWARQLGGAANDFNPYALAAANDRVYMAGGFHDTVDFDPGPGTANLSEGSGGVGFVWTLDANGDYVAAWQLSVGMSDLVIEGDQLYLRGMYYSTTDFDPGPGDATRTTPVERNTFIARYNIAGQSPATPVPQFNWVTPLNVDASGIHGNIAHDATSLYVSSVAVAAPGNTDGIITRIVKADGLRQWTRQIQGPGSDYATTTVVESATGMLYAGGAFTSATIDFNPAAPGGEVINAGGSDGFILKLNAATGSFQKVWQSGGTGDSYVRVHDVRGNIVYASGYVTGIATFPTGDTRTSNGNMDTYLMALDQSVVLPAKFYVVNDGADRTYEYSSNGMSVEDYSVGSGNTAPRGAASTAAGDKVWGVDANKNVYVYNTTGGLLGSWSAGSLPANADVQGITTNGTDVWIVDTKGDKVYRYTGAATRTSGSQNAASSFSLSGSNTDPTDLVTDGSSIWIVNNGLLTDKVFKYTVGGSLLGSWTISSGGGSPTGITIDPSSVSNIWIVDSSSDRIYEFTSAASRTSGSQSPSTSFALAAGNTNPQGIADPSPPTQTRRASEGSAAADSSIDSALLAVVGELDGLLTGGKKRK